MATMSDAKQGPIERIRTFIDEVRVELGKVTWPTTDDLKVSTKVTLYMLLIMAAVIFGFDKVFQIAVVLLLGMAG